MTHQIVIKDLQFQGHCGVTEAERIIPQTIALDLVLDYHPKHWATIATTDDIANAMDYAQAAEQVIQTATAQHFHLLETMTEAILSQLSKEFPVEGVQLWVRKVRPPIKQIQGSVGVRVNRRRHSLLPDQAPASFLMDCLPLLPRGTALDVATGQGRNALYLAAQGFRVEGIDRDEEALARIASTAREQHLTNLTVRHVDLEGDPNGPPDLPQAAYDVILVFFYLYRPLFPILQRALRPGGMLMYETFLIDNHLRHHHPRRKEFCLGHNELLQLSTGMRVLRYDEGEHQGQAGTAPVYTARLLAQKENDRVQT